MNKIFENFAKEDKQMVNTHIKRCSTSLVIRKMQIKATMTYLKTSMNMAKMERTDDSKCWQDYKGTHTLFVGKL